jgi:hypothetical protein
MEENFPRERSRQKLLAALAGGRCRQPREEEAKIRGGIYLTGCVQVNQALA